MSGRRRMPIAFAVETYVPPPRGVLIDGSPLIESQSRRERPSTYNPLGDQIDHPMRVANSWALPYEQRERYKDE